AVGRQLDERLEQAGGTRKLVDNTRGRERDHRELERCPHITTQMAEVHRRALRRGARGSQTLAHGCNANLPYSSPARSHAARRQSISGSPRNGSSGWTGTKMTPAV